MSATVHALTPEPSGAAVRRPYGVAVYEDARPASGTYMVEAYLEHTCGIPLWRLWGVDRRGNMWEGVPPALRFTPSLQPVDPDRRRTPALLAPLQDATGAVIGVHATYLYRHLDGHVEAISRDTFGMQRGAAIRLGAVRNHMLALALTIESGLSVMAMRTVPDPVVWVGLTPENIAGGGIGNGHIDPWARGRLLPSTVPSQYQPGILPPDGVKEITLIEDRRRHPDIDCALFTRAAHRFHGMGRVVRRLHPPEGFLTFNEALKELG